MQLRIPAGQPAHVAALRRRLVGERRKGRYLGTGPTPKIEQMRIDEGKGCVRGERDALSRGGSATAVAATAPDLTGVAHALMASRSRCCSARSASRSRRRGKSSCSRGLNKAEVPLGQTDGVVARQRAHDRHAELRDRIGHQQAMAVAADAVEHDTARYGRRDRANRSPAPPPPRTAPAPIRRARAAPEIQTGRRDRRPHRCDHADPARRRTTP